MIFDLKVPPSMANLPSRVVGDPDAMRPGWREPMKGWRFGENHPKAKLTDAQVADLRRRHAAGERVKVLLIDFNISYPTYRAIVTMRSRVVRPASEIETEK